MIEQTIGRGLRLPFNGERTGFENIDKLTVVAHDNFNNVIAAAQNPDSILNKLNFIEIEETQLNERVEVECVKAESGTDLQAHEFGGTLIVQGGIRE